MHNFIVSLLLDLLSMNGMYMHFNEPLSLSTTFIDSRFLHINISEGNLKLYSHDGNFLYEAGISSFSNDIVKCESLQAEFRRVSPEKYEFIVHYLRKKTTFDYLKIKKISNSIGNLKIESNRVKEIDGYFFYKYNKSKHIAQLYPIIEVKQDSLEYFNTINWKIEKAPTND